MNSLYLLKFTNTQNYPQSSNQDLQVPQIKKIMQKMFQYSINKQLSSSKSYPTIVQNTNIIDSSQKTNVKAHQVKINWNHKPSQLQKQFQIEYKRTRSISNMVSKNSLIVSTQFEEEEELSNQIKLHTNLPQNQIKIEIIDKVQSNYEQSQNRYAKFKAQQQQLQNESYQKSDNQELNSLRQSLFSIIENSRVQRHKFYQFGNTDQQLQLLEKLYLQNEKLVKNYVQIRQEAQQLDQKVKSLSNQRKQFRIQ